MPAIASDPKTMARYAPESMTAVMGDSLSNARALLSTLSATLESDPDARAEDWEWGCVLTLQTAQALIAHKEVRAQSGPAKPEPQPAERLAPVADQAPADLIETATGKLQRAVLSAQYIRNMLRDDLKGMSIHPELAAANLLQDIDAALAAIYELPALEANHE